MNATTEPRRFSRPVASDEGGIIPFVMILIPTLILIVGVAYDASLLFDARRETYNLASAAARAGATQVSADSIYEGAPVLDRSAASFAAIDFIAAEDATLQRPAPGDQWMVFTVRRRVDFVFLAVIGFDGTEVEATARARLKQGRDN